MSLAAKATMTAIEFRAWLESRSGSQRYELVSGEAVAMAPERNRHNLVKMACHRALEDAVRTAGLDCTVLGDGASVLVSEIDVYEPDAVVQCGAPVDLDATTVPVPTVLVEVLSPSTRGVDAGGKLVGYFELPSVEHYLIIDPARRVIIHHARAGHGIDTALLRDGRVKLHPPGIEFDVASCFASLGVECS